MATGIQQILEGIETRIETIDGLRIAPYLPGQVTVPQAWAGVPAVTAYHGAMSMGNVVSEPTVTLVTSAASDRAGQAKLAGYVDPAGPTSRRAAVEYDRTLGGLVDDCIVVSFQPFGIETIAAIGYYGGVFQLRVMASGA